MNKAELSGVCRQMRRDIINMTANAGSGQKRTSRRLPVRGGAGGQRIL